MSGTGDHHATLQSATGLVVMALLKVLALLFVLCSFKNVFFAVLVHQKSKGLIMFNGWGSVIVSVYFYSQNCL